MSSTRVTISIDIESVDGEDEATMRENERMARALEYGIRNTASIEELAAMCYLSPSTFKRRFRLRESMSPHQWFIKHKLELAHRIIQEQELSIKELSELCGFNSPSHFIYLFRTRYGTSPAKLIKLYHSEEQTPNDCAKSTITDKDRELK